MQYKRTIRPDSDSDSSRESSTAGKADRDSGSAKTKAGTPNLSAILPLTFTLFSSLASSFVCGSALAQGMLQTVHLRVGGKEVVCKVPPVADDVNTFVPVDALASMGLEAKADGKGETAVVTQPATRRSTTLAFARPNGKYMLSLTEVANFLNAHIIRGEKIEHNRSIPGSKGDTVYLLAKVSDIRFQNNALRVTTSFPIPYQIHLVTNEKPVVTRVECFGAEIPYNMQTTGDNTLVKIHPAQYSLETGRISIELPTGMTLPTTDQMVNSSAIIVAEISKKGSKQVAVAPKTGGTVRPPATGNPVPPRDTDIAGDPASISAQTSGSKADPKSDPNNDQPAVAASGTPVAPQRGNLPSRGGAVKRKLPVELRALELVPESDSLVHLNIATSDSSTPFVHYLPGGQLEVVVPNSLLNLPEGVDADQKLMHPLLTGIHVEAVPGTPSSTRIVCETTRIVGFTITNQGNKISVDMRLPRNATGALANKVIVVDAGHGGSSTGATAGGFMEKNITLQIALKLREALENCGAKVVMTRDKDVDVALSARPNLANDLSADLFVSVHNDSFTSDARGTSTFFHMSDPSSRALANSVSQAVASVSGIPNRGALSDSILYNSGLAVLRESTMPAILVEVAFISNTQDRRKLIDSDFQQRVATAICNGVRAYVEGGTPNGGRRMGMEVKEAPPIPGDDLGKSSNLDQ